jgi:hypothetical protein
MLNSRFAVDPTPGKSRENETTTQAALDASHSQKEYDTQLNALKTSIQKKLSCFIEDSSLPQALSSMRKEFESLKYHANQAVELLKQRDNFRIVPYKQRYKTALKLTTHRYNEIEYEDFKYLEQALDNTALVDAFPHEATIFKLGILYYLRLKNLIAERIGTYSLLIRENSVMDAYKLSIEGEKIRLVSGWELAKNVYERLMRTTDEDARKAFQQSCGRFERLSFLGKETMEISERLMQLKRSQEHLDAQNINRKEESNLSIAFTLPQVPEHEVSPTSIYAQTVNAQVENVNHDYFHFSLGKILFDYLNSVVPDHKKQQVAFCHIQSIRLEAFMQACLSKTQKGLSAAQSRTARGRFIIKLTEITAEARHSMDGEISGDVFYPYDFYATYCAKPENIIKKIHTIYEEYQTDQKEIIPCHLQGKLLTKAFITHIEKKLFPPVKEPTQLKQRESLEIDKKKQIDKKKREEWETFKNFMLNVNEPADILLYGPSEKAGAVAIVSKAKLTQSYQSAQTIQKEVASLKEKSIKNGKNLGRKNSTLFSLFKFKRSPTVTCSKQSDLCPLVVSRPV